MADLIDRQLALKAIQDLYPTMPRINFGDNISNWQQKYRQYIECEKVIRILPNADVQPVVRCKYCKWYKTNYSWNGKEHKVCVIEPYEPVRKDADFCSRGERKDG